MKGHFSVTPYFREFFLFVLECVSGIFKKFVLFNFQNRITHWEQLIYLCGLIRTVSNTIRYLQKLGGNKCKSKGFICNWPIFVRIPLVSLIP